MKITLAHSMVRLLARIPLQITRFVGTMTDWIIRVTDIRQHRFTELNLRPAFPDMRAQEHARQVKGSDLG